MSRDARTDDVDTDDPERRSHGELRLTSKTDQVHRRLSDDIVLGRLRPGMPVSERALAVDYNVSRVPVREALIRLERDGLVESWPGRGAVVRGYSAENMRSLYHVRESLEGMAARLAAERPLRDGFSVLRKQLVAELKKKSPDLTALAKLGDEFHDAVIQRSRNSVLIEMTATITDRVKIGRRLSYDGGTETQLYTQAGHDHLRIAEAIDRGDPDAAESIMRSHIATWSAVLQSAMVGDQLPR